MDTVGKLCKGLSHLSPSEPFCSLRYVNRKTKYCVWKTPVYGKAGSEDLIEVIRDDCQ